MKEMRTNIIVVLLVFSSVFLFGELFMRTYQLIKFNRPLFFSNKGSGQPIYKSNKLGWRATENYAYHGIKSDAIGREYAVDIKTDENGFRLYGKHNSNKIKILIIGDSFTQAVEVSNNAAYYAVAESKLNNVEMFVYGSGGYGSLQEYMILDEFVDKIKPDIFILQFCTNDFINNDWQLEHDSYLNNNGLKRPYIDLQGNIFYKNPKHIFFLPDILLDNSRLIDFIYGEANIILSNRNQYNTIEAKIRQDGQLHKRFQESITKTEIILDMMQKRLSGAKFVIFCADNDQPFYDVIKGLCQKKNYDFIDGIPQTIREYEVRGSVVRAADGAHWNELGHALAGEKISEYLQQHFK